MSSLSTLQEAGPVAHARRLASRVRDRGLEIEQHRALPPDLVDEIRASGLFHLMTPASLGGSESAPRTVVEVVEEFSRADASAGWTVMICQGAGFLAWLEADVAARIVAGRPRPVIVGSMAPMGRAEPGTGRASRISGRWPYTSACGLADLIIGAFTEDTGRRPAPPRFALFQPAQVTIHDTWRVMGLRGTGSHDIEVRDAEVPAELTFDPFGPAREPGPLYRLPYMTYLLTTMAGFPLGLARRIVDEYVAATTTEQGVDGVRMAESPVVRADLARCEAAVRAARAGVFEALDAVWEEALAGVPSPRTRAGFTGAVQHAMRTALEVADAAVRACGTAHLYEHAPLQRCFRDAQAAAAHVAFGLDAQRRVGAALLGLDVPLALL